MGSGLQGKCLHYLVCELAGLLLKEQYLLFLFSYFEEKKPVSQSNFEKKRLYH